MNPRLRKSRRAMAVTTVFFCLCFLHFTAALSSPSRDRDDIFASLDLHRELAPAPAPAPSSGHEAPIAGAFDVTNYGAVADGKSNCTTALLEAWEDACGQATESTVYIPEGTYFVGPILLSGPCRGEQSPAVVIVGTLKAPASLEAFPRRTDWIVFKDLRGVQISGGVLDAQGQEAWTQSTCHHQDTKCGTFPISLKLRNVSHGTISNMHIMNSKGFNMGIHGSNNVQVHDVSITAPADSPNTDGIHVSHSSNVNISSSHIGVGDDCVSIGPGSTNISVSHVNCGPGHGISVGSLGKHRGEENVKGVRVSNCTVNGTQNGLRIKTWPGAQPSMASDMRFEDIHMINVSNPILIDQEYCPSHSCKTTKPSLVHISDIHFRNITGTYQKQSAVTLLCSSSVPCQNVLLNHINLTGITQEQEDEDDDTDASLKGRFIVKGLLQGLQVLNSRF